MSFKIYKSIDGEWIMEVDGKPFARYNTLASLARNYLIRRYFNKKMV